CRPCSRARLRTPTQPCQSGHARSYRTTCPKPPRHGPPTSFHSKGEPHPTRVRSCAFSSRQPLHYILRRCQKQTNILQTYRQRLTGYAISRTALAARIQQATISAAVRLRRCSDGLHQAVLPSPLELRGERKRGHLRHDCRVEVCGPDQIVQHV